LGKSAIFSPRCGRGFLAALKRPRAFRFPGNERWLAQTAATPAARPNRPAQKKKRFRRSAHFRTSSCPMQGLFRFLVHQKTRLRTPSSVCPPRFFFKTEKLKQKNKNSQLATISIFEQKNLDFGEIGPRGFCMLLHLWGLPIRGSFER